MKEKHLTFIRARLSALKHDFSYKGNTLYLIKSNVFDTKHLKERLFSDEE